VKVLIVTVVLINNNIYKSFQHTCTHEDMHTYTRMYVGTETLEEEITACSLSRIAVTYFKTDSGEIS